jgi:hypothetical protein
MAMNNHAVSAGTTLAFPLPATGPLSTITGCIRDTRRLPLLASTLPFWRLARNNGIGLLCLPERITHNMGIVGETPTPNLIH